ncbi:MAG: tRNA preQ1(34) S-adenosylmethionine ribosyltransferase-isomerase QueA [Fimbriimonadaceae bacterium]|nr:tRNA preQ1(34) S-adenosylmethionine ribosyltransferase-isomerase QueA [Chthonomonadaceae bacterium]MCO5298261.1 tRNA preQ1(34) S-adenosylmethionine ribosyltransferase-isomerase QueA [Fimbriimonadaceae bacterium]
MRPLDYDLPEDRIAQRPLADRAASKLLHLDPSSGRVAHLAFRDAPTLLREGDLLVLNDTRVTALRLIGAKPSGAQVEFFLLRPAGQDRFEALVRPGRKLRPGATAEFEGGITGRVEALLPDARRLVSLHHPRGLDRALESVGRVPLPPYIHELLDDPERYQTVYARTPGSTAAPTAGLHFTDAILEAIEARGASIAFVTLDVGLDTFRPIQADDLDDHPMHGERCAVPEATAEAVAACKGRVVAVGTTSVRTLETFSKGPRAIEPGEAVSRLFIRPGYRFLSVDGMFTNFHMPRTTMLSMLAAMAGEENVLRAYSEALENGYRFLSFGDSMVLL